MTLVEGSEPVHHLTGLDLIQVVTSPGQSHGSGPVDLGDRLFAALEVGCTESAPRLHALLEETVQIIASDLPEVDVSRIEKALNHGR